VVTDTQIHPQTHKPTDRTDYNTLRRSFASAQCKDVLQFVKCPRTETKEQRHTIHKNKDKDLQLVLKLSLRTRTRINITASQ